MQTAESERDESLRVLQETLQAFGLVPTRDLETSQVLFSQMRFAFSLEC
jgi:hypothetical protein